MQELDHRAFKDRIYEQFARLTKAMSSARRLELLDLLAQAERTVEELSRETGMSVANVSQHLQTLKGAQLVDVRRQGLYAYYRLADEQVFRVWQAIRDLGETRLAELERVVQTFLRDRGELEKVSVGELAERLQDRKLMVLDVRPEEEYRAGHIAGAHSVPLARLEEYLRKIPKSAEVIAYCRGPYCVFSDEAVALLRAHGFEARRLEAGLPDWRAAGHPIERS
jgi:rhodanese-related sulfurtransferase/DNA-binding transcriptional ArsR family regulator